MFEGAVAAFLNRLLGRYVEDLDTEHFNVGIFSGDTCLTDLILKPEALYQLGLPIKVQVGLVGKISLKIPWVNLFAQPVILNIEDVFIVAVPETFGPYDSEIQKRLVRAIKKKILDDLEGDKQGIPNFMSDILSSMVKNFQITVNNVHIRYEEKLTGDLFVTAGICLQSLSVATTNNKWKPGVTPANSTSAYQLMKVESLSVYLNPVAESCFKDYSKEWNRNSLLSWKETMCKSLQTFGMNDQEFQFLIKPFTTKVKVIMSKNNNAEISRMLVDIVLQDIAMQISKQQYAAFSRLQDSMRRMVISRNYRKFYPSISIGKGGAKHWWKYAYNAIVEYNIRPCMWNYLITHRQNYRNYKKAYMETLMKPNDTELKLDLQKYEDSLNVLNIIIAREHAKIELENLHPTKVKINLGVFAVRTVSVEKSQDLLGRSRDLCDKIICNDDDDDLEQTVNVPERIVKSFDRKYNFTLVNCALSLLNNDKEILIISMTQFLSSIETRPDSSSFKISTRAESFVIEGVSSENDLVTIVTTNTIFTGNVASNFLAIDFEKSVLPTHCNYDLNATLEPIEMTYYNYSVAELINFFELNATQVPTVTSSLYKTYMKIEKEVIELSEKALSRTTRINLKLDMKGPYIVFPEYGAVQKEGYILIVDFGRLTLKTELQPIDVQLEDATIMELEELLYDRLHLVLNDGQIIICHGGDDWRDIRKLKESEFHIVPKLQANITIASSIRPEYRILPKIKVNISASQIKFNLSENKFQLLMMFLNLLTIPSSSDVDEMKNTFVKYIQTRKRSELFSISDLCRVKSAIVWASVCTAQNNKSELMSKELNHCNSTEVERSIISSEISEEDLEQWFKSSNFSGFEDFVSPSNFINFLLRFVIGELSVQFVQSGSDERSEPYLVLKLGNIYSEIAMMKYGFAIQSGLGTILLADKTEVGVTGSYLELISSDPTSEIFSLSYRKIRADCPDFKIHFKNVECSSVMNVGHVNIVFHRCAIIKLKHFVTDIIKICNTDSVKRILDLIQFGFTFCKKKKEDPPVPPGAIKLSYSIRLNTVTIKLCNKDEDLFYIKFVGLENDCIYNANERMILRAHLRRLSVDDLCDNSFYSKLLSSEDDKVFDLKYVRHAPKLYKCQDIDTRKVDILTDGSLKFSIGKINYVFMSRNIRDFQRFLNPFILTFWRRITFRMKNLLSWSILAFRRSETKLRLSIDLQGPILLLPQKRTAPTLLIFDIGTLSIENFFKKSEISKQLSKTNSFENQTDCNYSYIIDNVLIKLKAMTMCRANMTLAGSCEMREPIIEEVSIRYDVKRKFMIKNNDVSQVHNILYDIQGSVDLISINVAQKDLHSMLVIWEDNISKLLSIGDCIYSGSTTFLHRPKQDPVVRKLEAFFSQDEQPYSEISMKMTFDGLHVNLFSDTDEVLSSPIRDYNRGLCKLSFDEAILLLDYFSDNSFNVKIAVKTCMLEDIRTCARIVQKIIQSPLKDCGKNGESKVYVSMPPALDVTLNRTPAGDICLDILIEESQLNISVSFFTELGRFLINSIPYEQDDEGVVNEAYEDPETTIKNVVKRNIEANYLKNEDQTYESSGYSLSLRMRKPEIWLYSSVESSNAHAILIDAELAIEKSRHKGSSSVIFTLSGLRAKSKSQDQNYHWVLQPCDIEIHRKHCSQESLVRVNVVISSVNIYLCVGVINSLINIVSEILNFLRESDVTVQNKMDFLSAGNHTDLWRPKEISRILYVETPKDNYNYRKNSLSNRSKKVRVCEVKSTSIEVLFVLEETLQKVPIFRSNFEVRGSINDWNEQFQMQFDVSVCAFCYDVNQNKWEPLIELCENHHSNQYKPWEITFRVHQAESFPLNSSLVESQPSGTRNSIKKRKIDSAFNEDEQNEDMIFIAPNEDSSKINDVNYNFEMEDESDNTDDEMGSDKLNHAFLNFLTIDSNDEDKSDSEESSKYEDDDEDRFKTETAAITANASAMKNRIVQKQAMHIIVHSKEMINFTISTNTISVLDLLMNAFENDKNGIPAVPAKVGKLTLQNSIGYPSKVDFFVKKEKSVAKDDLVLVASQSFPKTTSPTSLPASPTSPDSEFPNSQINDFASNSEDIKNYFNENEDSRICVPSSFNDNDSLLAMYNQIIKERLKIYVEGFENIVLYSSNIKHQSYNLVPLRPTKDGIRYDIVVETTTNWRLHKNITVRSPLQIRNETSCVLELYYKKQTLEKLKLKNLGETVNPFADFMRMTLLEPEGVYNVPLFIAYHCSIHVLPAYSEKHQISNDGIFWLDMDDNANFIKEITCDSKEPAGDGSVFSVKAIRCKSNYVSHSNRQTPEYLIKIVPPLVFDNKLYLPIQINIPHINYQIQLEPGERSNVYPVQCDEEFQITIKIPKYLGHQWIGKVQLTSVLEKKYVKMVSDQTDKAEAKPFLLCVEIDRTTCMLINVYAQYWIINKTSLPLSIGESQTNTIHDISGEELVILSQKETRKRRRSIRLKAQCSDWSASFKLDGIGSMSLILCKDLERRRKYRIFVETCVSRLAPLFTKIVTFLPYFYVANKTKKTIRYMESNEEADLWVDLQPGQGSPFWPYTESMKMKVKWKNSQQVSECFDIMKLGKTTLRMDNGTAVCVEVSGGSTTPYIIVFHKYRPGDAPVRVDNICNNLILKINQIHLGQTTLIKPLHSILYTWDDPTNERQLMWNAYQGLGKGFSAEIKKDGFGVEKICLRSISLLSKKSTSSSGSTDSANFVFVEENGTERPENGCHCDKIYSATIDKTTENNHVIVYWVSYMEREQKVIMFTQDENIFRHVKSFVDPEMTDREMFVTLAGIGISLVKNNTIHENKELAYLSLSDSAAQWEVFVGQRWKQLTIELSAWLEDKYARSLARAQFQNLLDINLSKMYMTKPFFGKLRRSYSPGLMFQYRRSASLCFIHGFLHKVQIDNQCYDAVFPIVLHFSKKQYLCNSSDSRKFKHCMEFHCLKKYKPNRTIYKDLTIFVEEFNLNLQQDFLVQLISNFTLPRFQSQKSVAAKIRKDLSAYRTNLLHIDDQKDLEDHHNFIEHMYITPITFQLKLIASTDDCSFVNALYSQFDFCGVVKLVFDYVCTGIFEKDAEFKLPSYELNNHALRNKVFLFNVWNFYTGKILQQFNLLIRSIAVLGNPYDNMKMSEGPINETLILTYKDEVAEKLASDLAYYLGFLIVDSTSQVAVSNAYDAQIKPALKGKTQHNESSNDTFTQMSPIKNTMMIETEIELAYSGLVVQPVDGTHHEELKYFFKTLGKKLLRLTKEKDKDSSVQLVHFCPNSISDTFKRAQEAGFKFISRVRLPRAIIRYNGVETYSSDKARGFYLWNCINKTYFSLKDSFWAYAVLGNEGKRIALVSMQRIFLVDKKTAWGNWNVEWMIEMCHLVTPPVLTKHKIILNVNKSRRPVSPDVEWYLESKNEAILEWLCHKINVAMILNMENDAHLLKEESSN